MAMTTLVAFFIVDGIITAFVAIGRHVGEKGEMTQGPLTCGP
jgi:hypothetical protein